MPSEYTTRSGDTWDVIAVRAYSARLPTPIGAERYMFVLLDANPAHNYVARFDSGVELVVPDLPAPALPQSLPPWRR